VANGKKDNEVEHVELNEISSTTKTPKKKKLRQISLRRTIKLKSKTKPYLNNNPRKKMLDRKLIKMICLDFQPLSIVDNEGFIEYSHAMEERYVLPSRKTVTETLLPNFYEECMATLLELLVTKVT
jgi:hypothetical protein